MQLFYQDNFASNPILSEMDSKHCIRVLRKKNGDLVWVTNGQGDLYKCNIVDDHPKRAKLSIVEVQSEFEKPKRNIKIAIAPTKNMDRMTYFVEKAVEIGVSEIYFIKSQNSERRNINLERMERIAISAMKQSIKTYLPIMKDISPFDSFVNECISSQKILAHLNEKSSPLSKKSIIDDVCIMIGPEGDFSKEEVSLALKNDFELVSLGNSRLRTETAGIVSLTLLNLI